MTGHEIAHIEVLNQKVEKKLASPEELQEWRRLPRSCDHEMADGSSARQAFESLSHGTVEVCQLCGHAVIET